MALEFEGVNFWIFKEDWDVLALKDFGLDFKGKKVLVGFFF